MSGFRSKMMTRISLEAQFEDELERHQRHTLPELSSDGRVIKCECGEALMILDGTVRTHSRHIAKALTKLTLGMLDQAWHEGAESATNRPLYGAVPRSPYA